MISFEISEFFKATPSEVYDAWLNGVLHSAMTGSPAEGQPKLNTFFSAWDNYISGKNIELIKDKRIVQLWRTSDFTDDDGDSTIEILLEEVPEGCKLTLKHTDIPEGQPDYKQGWVDSYFKPMADYFS